MSSDEIKPTRVRVAISVDPDVHELLLYLARKSDRSLSNVGEIILEAGLPWLVDESRRSWDGRGSELMGMMRIFATYIERWRNWKKQDEEAEATGASVIPFVARES